MPNVEAITNELDAYWAEVSRTVAEGDFEGYAALYHEDAVLVSSPSQASMPISEDGDGIPEISGYGRGMGGLEVNGSFASCTRTSCCPSRGDDATPPLA